jgi:hypothetical protein
MPGTAGSRSVRAAWGRQAGNIVGGEGQTWVVRVMGGEWLVRPGRPRDYSLGLPQIRACTLNAPGSSRCGASLSLTRPGRFAVTRSQARYPGRSSNSPSTTRRPLRSTGSGRAVPPLHRYYGALRLPECLLASLRFLRSAIPRSACVSSPFGRRCVADGSSRRLLYRSLLIRSSSRSCQDLPRSRETRAIIRHVPPTPV